MLLAWAVQLQHSDNIKYLTPLSCDCIPAQELPEHLKELKASQLPWASFPRWTAPVPWQLSELLYKDGKNGLANCNSHKVTYS